MLTTQLEDGGDLLYTSLAQRLPTTHSPAGALLGALPDTTRLVTAPHPHTFMDLPQWENGQVTEFLVATQGWLHARSTNGWSLGCLCLPLGCSRDGEISNSRAFSPSPMLALS